MEGGLWAHLGMAHTARLLNVQCKLLARALAGEGSGQRLARVWGGGGGHPALVPALVVEKGLRWIGPCSVTVIGDLVTGTCCPYGLLFTLQEPSSLSMVLGVLKKGSGDRVVGEGLGA